MWKIFDVRYEGGYEWDIWIKWMKWDRNSIQFSFDKMIVNHDGLVLLQRNSWIQKFKDTR